MRSALFDSRRLLECRAVRSALAAGTCQSRAQIALRATQSNVKRTYRREVGRRSCRGLLALDAGEQELDLPDDGVRQLELDGAAFVRVVGSGREA